MVKRPNGKCKTRKSRGEARGWAWANSSWSELNLEILGAAGGEDHQVGL